MVGDDLPSWVAQAQPNPGRECTVPPGAAA